MFVITDTGFYLGMRDAYERIHFKNRTLCIQDTVCIHYAYIPGIYQGITYPGIY